MGEYRGKYQGEEGSKVRERIISSFGVDEHNAYEFWLCYQNMRDSGSGPKAALLYAIGHTNVSARTVDYFTAMALELFTKEYFEKVKEQMNG